MRAVRPHMTIVLVLSVAAVLLCCLVPGFAAEEKKVRLSFALPEGEVLVYKTSRMEEMITGGMDITVSHSLNVAISRDTVTEADGFRVELSFSGEEASLLRDDQLEDYEPDVKLEGKKAYAIINAKGEVKRADAASHIQGLSSEEQLREMIEDWFVKLPDAEVAVGGTWRVDILRTGLSQEGEEPEVKGYIEFKLKKVEEKNGRLIAEIEGKKYVNINIGSHYGRLIAEGKGDIKTKIAVDGGYVLECKRKMDVKGKTVGQDPITGKESERKTAITEYFECELER